MNKTIFPCVVGLGYVGLPVFTRLNKFYKTVGYDINKERVNSLLRKIHSHSREFQYLSAKFNYLIRESYSPCRELHNTGR